MAKQDAVQRACEMFNAPGNQVPSWQESMQMLYAGNTEVVPRLL